MILLPYFSGVAPFPWEMNPFYEITNDKVLDSSLIERFADTFSIFWGKPGSKDSKKAIGLVEYLLLPLDIIEGLLFITIIGPFLVGFFHVILETVISAVLTLACTPFILAAHFIICPIINYFNPPVRQNSQAGKEDVPHHDKEQEVTKIPVENHNTFENKPPSVFQSPTKEIPAQAELKFIWEDHPLGGKYTVMKSVENNQIFFWINSSSNLFTSINKNAVDDQFDTSLCGDPVGYNYTTLIFEQAFPNIEGKNYSDYTPAKYEENQQETESTSKIIL